ncbi:hypothetical protein LINPERPRIM_LOCUS23260 [Linum perenne]
MPLDRRQAEHRRQQRDQFLFIVLLRRWSTPLRRPPRNRVQREAAQDRDQEDRRPVEPVRRVLEEAERSVREAEEVLES